jgi:hypothetical protein
MDLGVSPSFTRVLGRLLTIRVLNHVYPRENY